MPKFQLNDLLATIETTTTVINGRIEEVPVIQGRVTQIEIIHHTTRGIDIVKYTIQEDFGRKHYIYEDALKLVASADFINELAAIVEGKTPDGVLREPHPLLLWLGNGRI